MREDPESGRIRKVLPGVLMNILQNRKEECLGVI